MKTHSYNILTIIISSFVFVLGINLFLVPAGLFSAGLTGVAMMLTELFTIMNIPIYFGLVYLLLNIPGVLLG